MGGRPFGRFVWMMSRARAVRQIGTSGVTEARWLIDALVARTRGHTPALRTIRPALVALALLSYAAAASAAGSARVRVEVTNLEAARGGQLLCALFAGERGFPEARGIKNVVVPLATKVAACEFHDLAPGVYAVSVLHDENMDGKLDKNLFGSPQEGYGVSNNHTHALSSPKWSESTFTVSADEGRRLAITLRY